MSYNIKAFNDQDKMLITKGNGECTITRPDYMNDEGYRDIINGVKDWPDVSYWFLYHDDGKCQTTIQLITNSKYVDSTTVQELK